MRLLAALAASLLPAAALAHPSRGIVVDRGGIVLLEASDHRPGEPTRMRVRQVGGDGRSRLLAQVTVPAP